MTVDVVSVRQDIAEYLDSHYDIALDEIDSDATMSDIGLDSLGVLAIADLIENKHGISLDDERIVAVQTFSDLMELIQIKAAERA